MEELLSKIGEEYQMFFEDGNYRGCFYPVYVLYPHLPKYPLNAKDPSESWEYGLNLILNHADRIKGVEAKEGDLLVCRYNNELHVAVVLADNKCIHVFRGHTMRINRLSFFGERPLMFFRVK